MSILTVVDRPWRLAAVLSAYLLLGPVSALLIGTVVRRRDGQIPSDDRQAAAPD